MTGVPHLSVVRPRNSEKDAILSRLRDDAANCRDLESRAPTARLKDAFRTLAAHVEMTMGEVEKHWRE